MVASTMSNKLLEAAAERHWSAGEYDIQMWCCSLAPAYRR